MKTIKIKVKVRKQDHTKREFEVFQLESFDELVKFAGGKKEALEFINQHLKNILNTHIRNTARWNQTITDKALEDSAKAFRPNSKRARIEAKIKELQSKLESL